MIPFIKSLLQKLKKILQFLLNPRFLLCFGIGWIITNGWAYFLFGLGSFTDVGWMKAVAGAYLAMLWFPFTPEKIITVGIAIALLCMKALLDNGFKKHVRLILTSDEEISNVLGGPQEIRFIQASAAGFPCAINCETAENDEVVIARKAILKYRLDIHGASGHSGKHYFNSKNAILEAAHKIIALHEKSIPGGTTYSCNIIQGGKVLNIIPDSCSISLDIRAVTVEDMENARKTVEQIAQTAFIPGTSCDVTLLSTRPPMEKRPQTLALLNKLLDVCHKYQLGTLSPLEAGGGSDSCYTQAAGIPSICGMGASGGKQHTPNEFLNIESVPLRAKILTSFLLDAD